MPYEIHDRLTLIGTIGPTASPVEQFSFGINLGSTGSYTRPTDPMADLAADCSAFFSDAAVKIGTNAQLRSIKLATIGADGLYTADPEIYEYGAPVAGGGGGFTYPPQVAMAVSLVTGRRGPTGRGRFYLPCPNIMVSNTGLVDEVDRDNLQAACATFLSNLANWPGIDPGAYGPIVASSKGYNSVVTGVRVGRVLDTIRTRRNQISEVYDEPTAVG